MNKNKQIEDYKEQSRLKHDSSIKANALLEECRNNQKNLQLFLDVETKDGKVLRLQNKEKDQ